MREILFRGKSTYKDKWFYGDLFHTEKDFKQVVEIIDFNEKPYTHIVDSSTIGQYTGLTDKNGTKIFEGDRLMNEDCGEGFEDALYYEVAYNEKLARFELVEVGYPIVIEEHGYDYVRSLEQLDEFIDIEEATICVVVGNIHDDPKLIE